MLTNQTFQKPPKDPQNLARQFAKQIANEPFEILKTATNQLNPEIQQNSQTASNQSRESQQDQAEEERKKQEDFVKSKRLLGALEQEMKEIATQKLFSELQRKIAEGQVVYLNDYPELSMEQKQVLMAQAQAVKERNISPPKVFSEASSKKGRRMQGWGAKVKREQTKTETRQPPSG